MNLTLALLIGFIIGFLVGRAVGRSGASGKLFGIAEEQSRQKQENKEKIMKTVALRKAQGGDARISNDEVEKMLGVSDATAERYLDELEKEGKLTQVGKTGHRVYYRARE